MENDFVSTLRKEAQYNGRIIVINYGIDPIIEERINKKYDVKFIKYDRDISMFSIRYRHIAEVIEKLDEEISTILVIDSGDVWFQDSIIELFKISENKLSCIEEKRIIGKDEWTGKCINNLPDYVKRDVLNKTEGTCVKNSGVICGDRHIIGTMFSRIYLDILECGLEFFGIDQLFFNYEWNCIDRERKVIADEKYNYVLVSHKDEYIVTDCQRIETQNKGGIVVVHNAGGNWRELERPFANGCSNPEQYVIENISTIKVLK